MNLTGVPSSVLAELRAAAVGAGVKRLAIVGGAKVSTKLEVLESLAVIAKQILVGGGIANTFIAAAGYPVGKSLYEPDLIKLKCIILRNDICGGNVQHKSFLADFLPLNLVDFLPMLFQRRMRDGIVGLMLLLLNTMRVEPELLHQTEFISGNLVINRPCIGLGSL